MKKPRDRRKCGASPGSGECAPSPVYLCMVAYLRRLVKGRRFCFDKERNVSFFKENPLTTNYVLIDFENVQPKNLEILASHPFKVFVFIGANQSKISVDLAAAMQDLGENAKYIKMSGSGQNALDFHIAYYLGQLSSQDPEANFYIISKDTGFDPLIKHLEAKKIQIQREKNLAEIPVLRMSIATSNDEKIAAIVKNLSGRGQGKPRKVKTLANTINSLFTKKLKEQELTDLVKELEQLQYIVINQGNVSYKLPQ